MPRPFKGTIKLDVRDSVADWDAFTATRRPRARRTSSWCSSTTPGRRRGRRTAGGSRCRRCERLADGGLTYSQWHTTALCSPTRSTFLTGRNHHSNGFASISESASGFPGYSSHIPPENGTIAHVLRDAGYSTFWVGKNHNVPVDAWTQGSSKKEWPLGPGLRPLLRLHRRRDQPVVSRPRRGQPLHRPAVPARGRLPPVQGPRRPGAAVHPRLQAVRARQAVVPVVLPGRQPRPAPRAAGVHRQVQGQVRRRLRGLPRVGAAADDRARHPARGDRADADQPDARGHVPEGDAVRPWDTLSDEEKALFCRMAEVYAGFSEYTDHQVGRIVDYLEESGPARQHDHLLRRRQRRLGRGQPERLGQRGQVLQRLSRTRSRTTCRCSTSSARRRRTTTTRPAGRWRSRRPTGCSSATRTRAASATRSSSTGRRGSGPRRGARPVPPLDRHLPDDPRRVRDRDAGGRSTASSSPRSRASRCATRSTTAGAPTHKETQYYEMFGMRGLWHKGWKVVDRARPDQLDWATSRTTRGSSSTPTRTAPRRTTSPREHPDKVKELVALWFAEAKATTSSRSTT